jgi:hypothetical protein
VLAIILPIVDIGLGHGGIEAIADPKEASNPPPGLP